MSDEYWNYVSLLAHFDGVDGAVTTVDSSDNALPLTMVGTQLSSAQTKFGTTSLRSSAGYSNYVTTPDIDGLKLLGDFTIEFWLYPTTLTGIYQSLYVKGSGAIRLLPTYIEVRADDGTNYISGGAHGMSVNNWYHIAITRASGFYRVFVNGVLKATSVYGAYGIGDNTSALTIFNSTASYHTYIDDFRVTKGIARYTADFTPPTAAFPNTGPALFFSSPVAAANVQGTLTGIPAALVGTISTEAHSYLVSDMHSISRAEARAIADICALNTIPVFSENFSSVSDSSFQYGWDSCARSANGQTLIFVGSCWDASGTIVATNKYALGMSGGASWDIGWSAVFPRTDYWSSVRNLEGYYYVGVTYDATAEYPDTQYTYRMPETGYINQWSLVTLPFQARWTDFTYGNGFYVALARSVGGAATRRYAVSEDGLTWSEMALPSEQFWASIAFSHGVFVCANASRSAYCVSYDGLTWTQYAGGPGRLFALNDKFFASRGTATNGLISDDGITWTDAGEIFQHAAHYRGTYHDIYVVTHGSTSGLYGWVSVSIDEGVTWTRHRTDIAHNSWGGGVTQPYGAVLHNGDHFVVASYADLINGSLSYGVNIWVNPAVQGDTTLRAQPLTVATLTPTPTKYIFGRATATASATHIPGLEGVVRTGGVSLIDTWGPLPAGVTPQRIAAIPSKVVIVGSNGQAYTTTDISQAATSSGTYSGVDIVAGATTFVSWYWGSANVYYSATGTDWTLALTLPAPPQAVKFINGEFVAWVSGTKTVYRSTTGATWTSDTVLTDNLYGLWYENGNYLAVKFFGGYLLTYSVTLTGTFTDSSFPAQLHSYDFVSIDYIYGRYVVRMYSASAPYTVGLGASLAGAWQIVPVTGMLSLGQQHRIGNALINEGTTWFSSRDGIDWVDSRISVDDNGGYATVTPDGRLLSPVYDSSRPWVRRYNVSLGADARGTLVSLPLPFSGRAVSEATSSIALTTQIQFNASAYSTAAFSGALSAYIRFAASISALVEAQAILYQPQAYFDSAITALAVAAGEVTAHVRLAASVAAMTTVAAPLSAQIALAAETGASALASLFPPSFFEAVLSTSAITASNLSTQLWLSTISDDGAYSAPLGGIAHLTFTTGYTAPSGASADLNFVGAAVGLIGAIASTEASLRPQFKASVAVVSIISASFQIGAELESTAYAQAYTTAPLLVPLPLGASSYAVSASEGGLTLPIWLGSNAIAAAMASSELTTAIRTEGSVVSVASVYATASTSIRVSAGVAAIALTAGQLSTDILTIAASSAFTTALSGLATEIRVGAVSAGQVSSYAALHTLLRLLAAVQASQSDGGALSTHITLTTLGKSAASTTCGITVGAGLFADGYILASVIGDIVVPWDAQYKRGSISVLQQVNQVVTQVDDVILTAYTQ